MRCEVGKQIGRRVLTALERQEFVAAAHVTNSAEETVLCTTFSEEEGGLTKFIGDGVRLDGGGFLRVFSVWCGPWNVDGFGLLG